MTSDIELTRLQVKEGKRLVEEQRMRVAQRTADGGDVRSAALLLATFEKSLRAFEEHLAVLENKSQHSPAPK